MKNKKIGKESILNSQIFQSYKEELGKEYDFGELDKELEKKAKKYTNLGRS